MICHHQPIITHMTNRDQAATIHACMQQGYTHVDAQVPDEAERRLRRRAAARATALRAGAAHCARRLAGRQERGQSGGVAPSPLLHAGYLRAVHRDLPARHTAVQLLRLLPAEPWRQRAQAVEPAQPAAAQRGASRGGRGQAPAAVGVRVPPPQRPCTRESWEVQ